ncbi:MAG TPA: ABC transporter permease [Gemmataceae bacterium]
MRWPIVRLIAGREFRDLMRDRRTLFLVLGLPVILYPAFAGIGVFLAYSMLEQPILVGLVGGEHLPPGPPTPPAAAVAGGPLAAEAQRRHPAYPPLLFEGSFVYETSSSAGPEAGSPIVVREFPTPDRGPLDRREVDVMLVVPPGFAADLEAGRRPTLTVLGREGDETSKLAVRRVTKILDDWAARVKEVRFARAGLPPDFDKPVRVSDPFSDKEELKRTVDELRDTLVKFFPFLLVMWTIAGALHPAIDMTAGEKERGTMETLLISPAERLEIVAGKFLATCAFAYGTAVWNVLLMGGGALALSLFVNMIVPVGEIISFGGLAWALLFALPVAALFSAVCLALGLFARSTKEGQYYLVPMFLVTLPLTFWTLAPGVELDPVTSLVPVTGVALLLQELMSVAPRPGVGWYFLPVLGSLAVCVGLALAWAVWQFHRESVLFREGDRDIFSWLRGRLRGARA